MNLEYEAIVLTRYLIKKLPSQEAINLYNGAIKQLGLTASLQETNVWNFGLKHPWSIGLIDAGLAISDPHNTLRKRILIMLAILETQVEYHSLFLPVRRHRLHVLIIPYLVIRATFKMIAGKILLWMIFRK